MGKKYPEALTDINEKPDQLKTKHLFGYNIVLTSDDLQRWCILGDGRLQSLCIRSLSCLLTGRSPILESRERKGSQGARKGSSWDWTSSLPLSFNIEGSAPTSAPLSARPVSLN